MAETVLEARGVFKTYGAGPSSVKVLRGLDLEIAAAEYLILLGPSGSGKSTLLNIVGLMDEPTSGEVFFSGKPTSKMTETQKAALRNEHLGFVFQFDSLLPEFTVLENVTMPARIKSSGNQEALFEAERRGLELLSGLGLKPLRDRFPSEVSGGERQRVALCRALINKPAVLLADEPTGNLDKYSGELVFKDLKDLANHHGVAVVMVTHNESAGLYANRILHMLDGAIEGERIINVSQLPDAKLK